MKLSAEQQHALRQEHGICANEACDGCGKFLGSVRYTVKDDPRAFCSDECRAPFLPKDWQAHRAKKKQLAGGGKTLLGPKHQTIADRAASRRERTRARVRCLRLRKSHPQV